MGPNQGTNAYLDALGRDLCNKFLDPPSANLGAKESSSNHLRSSAPPLPTPDKDRREQSEFRDHGGKQR
ncbi:hypothetical protein M5K25_003227 [Dendrobium thyrsiflorum]|uniref:Uncharacterized protein n=1 Tax=Dendrobium thyrsiflorum TaxID=117978 RepID=A0ABD0VW51_DENTH